MLIRLGMPTTIALASRRSNATRRHAATGKALHLIARLAAIGASAGRWRHTATRDRAAMAAARGVAQIARELHAGQSRISLLDPDEALDPRRAACARVALLDVLRSTPSTAAVARAARAAETLDAMGLATVVTRAAHRIAAIVEQAVDGMIVEQYQPGAEIASCASASCGAVAPPGRSRCGACELRPGSSAAIGAMRAIYEAAGGGERGIDAILEVLKVAA